MPVVELVCQSPECPTFVKAFLADMEPEVLYEFVGSAIRAAEAQKQADAFAVNPRGSQVLGSMEALRRRTLAQVAAIAAEVDVDDRQSFVVSVIPASRYEPAEYRQDPVCPECGGHDFIEVGPADGPDVD
jgi:hypothetical protein